MGRLFVLLALGALGWWCYGAFVASDANSAQAGSGGGSAAVAADDVEREPLQVAPGADENPAADGDPRITKLVAGIAAGDERLRSNAFRVYVATRDPAERERLGRAIAKAAADATSVEQALALLGENNAFAHVDFGRALARKIVEQLRETEPPAALKAATGLIEAGLTGPLEPRHREAKKLLDDVLAVHRNLVRRVVFDPANAARARRYQIQAGDTLDGIARRFRKSGLAIESGTLELVNRIDNPKALKLGRNLRVPVDPVRCVLRKSSFSLAVYLGSDLVRVYWVAHGKPGHETPETTFTVGEKIANPDWPSPEGELIAFGDPRNPLGKFFVRFEHESYAGFGAHGTNEPDSIGTCASLGCLRLLPSDIAEFARFVPKGAEVETRR